MTIKKIENAIQAPEFETTYIDEVYVDAITDKGGAVKVIDRRRTRNITESQVDAELIADQAKLDATQAKKDEITAIKAAGAE